MARWLVGLVLLSLCVPFAAGCAKNPAKGKGTTAAETSDVQAKMKGAMAKGGAAPGPAGKAGN